MPVLDNADEVEIAAHPKRMRAAQREDWYVIPAQFALRLVSQPDTSDDEPRMLLLHPDRQGVDTPRRKLPRHTRGMK